MSEILQSPAIYWFARHNYLFEAWTVSYLML